MPSTAPAFPCGEMPSIQAFGKQANPLHGTINRRMQNHRPNLSGWCLDEKTEIPHWATRAKAWILCAADGAATARSNGTPPPPHASVDDPLGPIDSPNPSNTTRMELLPNAHLALASHQSKA